MLQVPKNVMQIGEINPHTKIYMEDYVHTFLERRKKAETYLAFGKKEETDDVSYYMIYGVEKKTDWDRGSFPYFKKYERIGTIEGVSGSWVLKPVRGSGIRLSGYFVFYEQNEDMQSYMIAVRETEEIAGSEEKEEVMEAVRAHREQHRKESQELSEDAADREDSLEDPVYREDAGRAGMETGKAPVRSAGRAESAGIKRGMRRKKRADWPQAGQLKALRHREDRGTFASGQRREPKRVVHTSRQKLRGEKKHGFTIPDLCRAGSLVLLLVLAATGLTSLNHYPDMKAVTELFSDAAKAVTGKSDDAVAAGAKPQEGSLIVEEAAPGEEEDMEVPEATQDALDGGETSDAGNELVLAQDGGQIQWTIGQKQEMPKSEEGGQQTEKSVDREPESISEPAERTAVSEEDGTKKQGREERAGENVSSEDATQAIARPVTYVVKKGDSLAGIARKFYGSSSKVKEICSVNGIEDPDQIRPGQNILLP